jgi:hypothetical protein
MDELADRVLENELGIRNGIHRARIVSGWKRLTEVKKEKTQKQKSLSVGWVVERPRAFSAVIFGTYPCSSVSFAS